MPDKGGTPIYAYQLWYIRTSLITWFIVYSIYKLFKRNIFARISIWVLLEMLMIAVEVNYNLSIQALFCTVAGAIAGDIVGLLNLDDTIWLRNKKCVVVFTIIIICASPFAFNSPPTIYNQMALGVYVSVFVLGLWIIEKSHNLISKIKTEIVLHRISCLTYEFYCTHVFVLTFFTSSFYRCVVNRYSDINVYIVCKVDWLLSVSFTIIVSIMLNRLLSTFKFNKHRGSADI